MIKQTVRKIGSRNRITIPFEFICKVEDGRIKYRKPNLKLKHKSFETIYWYSMTPDNAQFSPAYLLFKNSKVGFRYSLPNLTFINKDNNVIISYNDITNEIVLEF